MKPQFVFLAILHICIWLFVMLAFLNPTTARINLYYIVPLIYLIHVFPFHFINEAKRQMYPDDWEERTNSICDSIGLGKFRKLCDLLENFCFANPLSPQGMLIFGAISSAWVIK